MSISSYIVHSTKETGNINYLCDDTRKRIIENEDVYDPDLLAINFIANTNVYQFSLA